MDAIHGRDRHWRRAPHSRQAAPSAFAKLAVDRIVYIPVGLFAAGEEDAPSRRRPRRRVRSWSLRISSRMYSLLVL